MLRYLFTFLVCTLAAQSAEATCAGTDLRSGLTAMQRNELKSSVDATPFASGNHWQAVRGEDVLHLIGTLHLDDPRLKAPFDRLAPLIQSADLLLLEANDRDTTDLQKRLASDPSLILLQGDTLIDLMPAPDWDRLAEAAQARGIPPFMAAKMQPWYLSMTLAIPPCMMADFQSGANGLDAQLNQVANDANVPTRSLEDTQTLFQIFAQEPLETQIDMMKVSLTDAETAENGMTTTLATYFEEQIAEGWHINRILAPQLSQMSKNQADAVFEELEQELLVNRNRAWIPVILDAAAETDGPIVVAFGAAHLMGEFGVLNLLAQEGFTLSRQKF